VYNHSRLLYGRVHCIYRYLGMFLESKCAITVVYYMVECIVYIDIWVCFTDCFIVLKHTRALLDLIYNIISPFSDH
jgi:hypothetical protein